MPGSGKTTVASIAASSGFKVFSMGDIVRELAQNRGIEPTPEKLGEFMLTLRNEKGPTIVAAKTIEKIRQNGSLRICVEGLRSLQEVDMLSSEFYDFFIIAVHSSPRTRFTRLTARERRDDPKTHEIFTDRDRREIGVGLGDVLAIADFAIVNEGSLEELKSIASRVLQMVEISVQTHD